MSPCVFLSYGTWKDPSWGNVLVPGSGGRAVFFVCDKCQEASERGGDPGDVKFAVEVKDGQVILHPVEELEDVPAISREMVEEN